MHPNKVAFSEALQLILDSWSPLQWALDYHSSDPNRPTMSDLHSSLLDHFSVHGASLDELDLADILNQDIMLKEYDLVLEDESDLQVAKIMIKAYQDCIRGERTELMKLRERSLSKTFSKQHSVLIDKKPDVNENESEQNETDEEEPETNE